MPSSPVGRYPTLATTVGPVLATPLLSSMNCRNFGEAVIPSLPVARYPTEATAVVGVPFTIRFPLSFRNWRNLGDAAMPSSPTARYWAWLWLVEASSAARAVKIRSMFEFFILLLSLWCVCRTVSLITTPPPAESLDKFRRVRHAEDNERCLGTVDESEISWRA